MTVLSCLENLRDSVTDKKKPPWPGDFVVTPVAALSIAPMGVTTPWEAGPLYLILLLEPRLHVPTRVTLIRIKRVHTYSYILTRFSS